MKETGFPPNNFLQRFDGSHWRIFEINGGYVVVTNLGLKIMGFQKGHLKALQLYKNSLKHRAIDQNRRYLKSGGNSDVYIAGQQSIAIKEAKQSQSIWHSLDRLDKLHHLCCEYMPKHIRVPTHYAAIFSRYLDRQYLIMELANEGITLEDVELDPTKTSLAKKARLEFMKARDKLLFLSEKHFPHTEIITDWHEGNVIVDASQPTDQFPFTLWIIDQ